MYSFRILQNYSKDMFHCSLLRFDKASYLFNCCDGTQRNALDQGIKFPKIKSIFFNSSETDCYLGCYGFLMSRGEMNLSRAYALSKEQEAALKKKEDKKNKSKKPILNKMNGPEYKNPFEEIQQCQLYGPPNFSQNFIYSKDFFPVPINDYLYEYEESSDSFICKNIFNPKKISQPIKLYTDELISIIPIDIKNSNNIHAISYICIPKQKNRSFNKEKAIKLGLKPGPIYGKLQKGETITLDDGRVITLKDVSEEPLPSSSVLILYIPTEEHMNLLISNDIMKKYIEKKLGNEFIYNISLIVHITPKLNFINNDKYIHFMSTFGKDVEHIIECPEINEQFLYNEGKIKIQVLLSKVSKILFPEIVFSEKESKAPIAEAAETLNKLSKQIDINIKSSCPGREYIIYPPEKKGLVIKGLYDNIPYYFNSKNGEEFKNNISKLSIKNIDNELENMSKSDKYKNVPKITFLGTTSMKPGKFRNVSCIMIENQVENEQRYILFDCGEGTYQQMIEKFGFIKTEKILLNIKLIAISHKHGDHMLGLIKLLKEIDRLIITKKNQNLYFNESNYIYVVVPRTIIDFVNSSINMDIISKNYFKVFDCNVFNVNEKLNYQNYLIKEDPNKDFVDIPKLSPVNDYKILLSNILNFRKKENLISIYADFKKMFGAFFNTIEVFHCEESFGFFIENDAQFNSDSYWKISFSGDTRPNNNFFNYSMYSTVLIHEGTFDSELNEDALEKMHSTVGDAIKLGKENFSKYIVITHFSPRYIKTYPYKEEYEQIIFANDYLTFDLNNISQAYKYLKPFDEVISSIDKNLL